MTKQKSLKKSLAKSAVAMTLCAGMLIGSTYAWFSDEAKTGMNTIVAGNLDIALEVYTDGLNKGGGDLDHGRPDLYLGDSTKWKESTAEDPQDLFDQKDFDKIKWEPGMLEVSNPFRLSNNGSLYLAYELTANVGEETSYTWPEGSEFEGTTVKLSDAVKMAVVDVVTYVEATKDLDEHATYDQRLEAWNKMTNDGMTAENIATYKATGTIAPGNLGHGAEDAVDMIMPHVIVLFWEADKSTDIDNPDNEYNLPATVAAEQKLEISEFGLNVFATQTPAESDSFGNQYDAGLLQVKQVETAVTEGLNQANETISKAIEEQGIKNITVTASQVKFDAEKNAYTSEFKFDNTKSTNQNDTGTVLFGSYLIMSNLVLEKLNENIDVVESLSIGGEEVKPKKDGKFDNNGLVSPFMSWAVDTFGSWNGLFGHKGECDVVVNLKDGQNVKYILNFDLEKFTMKNN